MEENKGKISSLFVIIACLFVGCLIICNVITGKLITFCGLVLPGAIILFPVTYIFGDVLTEVYGFKKARLVIWTGFACNALMAGVFMLVLALPSPGFFHGNSAYATVLGMTPRIVFASLLAYFMGELANSVVLSKMKIFTKGKWLWTRTIGSTLVGEGIDTGIFIVIAFWGAVSGPVLIQMVFFQYVCKVAYEIAATPLTYAVVNWLKRKEAIDTFDYGVEYTPFSLNV